MKKYFAFAFLFLLSACAMQVGAEAPELMTPVMLRHDTFFVERGRVANVEHHRAAVRTSSEGLSFKETTLMPFGEFLVLAGQEVRAGDVLAVLDTTQLDENIERRREQINDLSVEHSHQNRRMERDIDIARLELLSINRQIEEADGQPPEHLLEAADLKRIEIQRRQVELDQARDWQSFDLSHYQSDLNEMLSQLRDAELVAPFDGIVVYRADIHQGSWLEDFSPIIFLSDESYLFAEYTGPSVPSISRSASLVGVVNGNSYAMERVILPASELLFFTRAGGTAPLRFAFIDEPGEEVRPGQLINIIVYMAVNEDVLRIPPNALFMSPELGSYVNLLENGTSVMQPVEVGLRTRAWIEIRSGLLEGDELIVQQ
jgi:hypothetical protein